MSNKNKKSALDKNENEQFWTVFYNKISTFHVTPTRLKVNMKSPWLLDIRKVSNNAHNLLTISIILT